MKRFRILTTQCYEDFFPVTIYMVQVRKGGRFFDDWVDIKGYASKDKAEELYNILEDNNL